MSEIDTKEQIDIKALKSCPKSELMRSSNNGRPAVFEVYYTGDGKRVRKTITADRNRQLEIARKYVLEYELKELRLRKKKLESLIFDWEKRDEFSTQRFLIKNFYWFSMGEIEKICYSDPEDDEWANAYFEQSDYLAEQKTIVTSRGLKVRSKSEALIAEALYRNKIAFRYEQKLYTNGVELIPDFTVRRRDGKIYYWEHEGLTNSRQYLEKQRWKETVYARAGIVPWDNLIVTYDSESGYIDLKIVEAEIQSRLLL